MAQYTEAELIRARRPIADASERGEAYCTLGHLEAEQRQAPTAERATIISEIASHIATFDGAAPLCADAPLPVPVVGTTRPRPASALALPAATAATELRTGIDLSVASMQRTLRRQGLAAAGEASAGPTVAANSMQRTLRRMGLAPQARG